MAIGRSFHGHTSQDRGVEWKWCCMQALRWYEIQDPEETDLRQDRKKRPRKDVVLVNLVEGQRRLRQTTPVSHESNQDSSHQSEDPDMFWKTAIQEIEDNMNRMIAWLGEKSWTYSLPQTSDQEASLIQSTISSYTVTSANELENLRRHYQTTMIPSAPKTRPSQRPRHAQQQQHDMAVIQILSERLKERVAEPFSKLQKQRHRAAVQLWQNPLSSRFVPTLRSAHDNDDDLDNKSNDDDMDRVLGLSNTNDGASSTIDRRFLPRRARHVLKHEQDFLNSYSNLPPRAPMRPQTFLSERLKRPRSSTPTATKGQATASGTDIIEDAEKKRTRLSFQQQPLPPSDTTDQFLFESVVKEEELQQEAVVLQAQQQRHELDAVQNMESTMVQITALLSQFPNW